MEKGWIRKNWNVPSCSAFGLGLREDGERLTFCRECGINTGPVRLVELPGDREATGGLIHNGIGRIFRGTTP